MVVKLYLVAKGGRQESIRSQKSMDQAFVEHPEQDWPGQNLGLPESGLGALASWRSRVAALIIDWALAMGAAVLIFGAVVVNGFDWQRLMIPPVFWFMTSVVMAFTGSSIGKLLAGIGVIKVGSNQPIGWQAVIRQALVTLVIPALVVGPDRRGMQDMVLGTAVINRRAPK